jgi:hypothetical protein
MKNETRKARLYAAGVAALALMGFSGCARGTEDAEKPAYDYLEYAVYVDALNLCAEPSLEAKVLAVLPAGAVVKRNSPLPLREEVDERLLAGSKEVDGIYWEKVRAGDIYGWVVYEYIMPRPLYEAYREADRLGKAGDAAGMVAAIEAAAPATHGFAVPSPDGRKVVVDASTEYEYNPYFGPDYSLYFESGKGLAHLFGGRLTTHGLWSPDSRYFAFRDARGYAEAKFVFLFDTVTHQYDGLGYTNDAAPMEYSNGHFIWLCFGAEGPELAAYELASGETTLLLKADAASSRKNEYGREEWKLVPAGPLPPALEGSRLYEEFNGAYVATISFPP